MYTHFNSPNDCGGDKDVLKNDNIFIWKYCTMFLTLANNGSLRDIIQDSFCMRQGYSFPLFFFFGCPHVKRAINLPVIYFIYYYDIHF